MRELQAETAKAAVMTLEEQRLLLAAVARGEHKGAKISDRLRAIEIDSKLAGHASGNDDKPRPSTVPRMIIRYGGDPVPEPDVAGEEPAPIICNLPEIFRYGRGERPQDHSPSAENGSTAGA